MTDTTAERLPTRDAAETVDVERRRRMLRHPAIIRLCQRNDVACMAVPLTTSGLQIFNSHPALHWAAPPTSIIPGR